jgi:hypothetical protein
LSPRRCLAVVARRGHVHDLRGAQLDSQLDCAHGYDRCITVRQGRA